MSAKKPFRHYTFEQIQSVEAITYVIVAGRDLFDSKGNYFFNKQTAIRYYNKIINETTRQLQFGTVSQKRNAKLILSNLRVEPLRIH